MKLAMYAYACMLYASPQMNYDSVCVCVFVYVCFRFDYKNIKQL